MNNFWMIDFCIALGSLKVVWSSLLLDNKKVLKMLGFKTFWPTFLWTTPGTLSCNMIEFNAVHHLLECMHMSYLIHHWKHLEWNSSLIINSCMFRTDRNLSVYVSVNARMQFVWGKIYATWAKRLPDCWSVTKQQWIQIVLQSSMSTVCQTRQRSSSMQSTNFNETLFLIWLE